MKYISPKNGIEFERVQLSKGRPFWRIIDGETILQPLYFEKMGNEFVYTPDLKFIYLQEDKIELLYNGQLNTYVKA